MPDLSQPQWAAGEPDRQERLADLLAEQGFTPPEAAEFGPLLEKLTRWQTPPVQPAKIEELTSLLASEMDADKTKDKASQPKTALRSNNWHANILEGWQHLGQLLKSQLVLIRREIWLASAFILGLGWIVSVILGSSLAANPSGLTLALLAPLIAATGLSLVYGPENDVGLELALTTPTSPRQVLLARFVLVFGYDLALTFLLSVAFKLALPLADLGALLALWVGPMFFLGGLALLLSLLFGSDRAIQLSLFLWALRVVAETNRANWGWLAGWAGLWTATPLLLGVAGALIISCFFVVKNREYSL